MAVIMVAPLCPSALDLEAVTADISTITVEVLENSRGGRLRQKNGRQKNGKSDLWSLSQDFLTFFCLSFFCLKSWLSRNSSGAHLHVRFLSSELKPSAFQ